MNNKRISLLILFPLVFAVGVLGGVSATSNPLTTVTNAANRLVALQNANGSWGNVNTVGISALGLLSAYNITRNSSYLNSAEAAGNYLVNIPTSTGIGNSDPNNKFYSQDIEFLAQLGTVSGNLSYTTKADDIMTAYLTQTNRYCSNGCSASALDLVYQGYYPIISGYSGQTEWQLASWVRAADFTGYTQFANELADNMSADISGATPYFNISNSSQITYIIGLSGIVSATGDTNTEQVLINAQLSNGSWSDSNGANQDTAYAVMALMGVGKIGNAMNGTLWLMSNQNSDGSWTDNTITGNPISEVTSEAIQAMIAGGGPYIVNISISPQYPNLTSTIINVFATIIDPLGLQNYPLLSWKINSSVYGSPVMNPQGNNNYLGIIGIPSPLNNMTILYKITASDLAGNSGYNNYNYLPLFTYDGSAPITTDNANSAWTNQNVQVTLTCADTISGCNRTYYSTDGTNPTNLYSSPFTLSNTGKYQLKYYSVDNANNQEVVKIGTLVQIDKALPVVSILYPLNIVYNHSITQLNYTRSDFNSGLASCWYSLNNGALNSTPDSSCSNFTPISIEGVNNWTVYAQDNAGNINSATIQFTQDTTPPVISYNPTTLLDKTYTNNNWILVNVSASDLHLSNVIFNWNSFNTTFAANVGSNYWTNETGLSDGNYTFYAWANDSVGNSNIVATRTVIVDTTPPQISYAIGTPINDSNLSQNYIFVNTTASDLNLKNVTTYLYNSHFVLINEDGNSANFTGLSNGIYYINATAYDLAGNLKSTETRVITLDTVAPTLNITSANSTDSMDYFTIEANSTDSVSGVNYVNLIVTNGAGNVVASGNMSLVPSTTKYDYMLLVGNLSVGNYSLKVSSFDNAGNVNYTLSNLAILNNVAPSQIIAINNQVNQATGGTVSFTFNLNSRGNGTILFGMDNIAGLTPHTLNAVISNGSVNATVGSGISFSGSQPLTLGNLSTLAPGVVNGNITLYLTFPANMVVGTYPVNYYINNA